MDSNFLNIIFLGVSELFGDFSLQSYVNSNSTNSLLWGIIGYIGVVFFLIKALRDAPILYVNGMWDGISAILESSLAFLLLGQRLKHTKQYIGLILIIIGIFFMKNGYGKPI
jgi:multidrug transporter EmrE-like cation transporter